MSIIKDLHAQPVAPQKHGLCIASEGLTVLQDNRPSPTFYGVKKTKGWVLVKQKEEIPKTNIYSKNHIFRDSSFQSNCQYYPKYDNRWSDSDVALSSHPSIPFFLNAYPSSCQCQLRCRVHPEQAASPSQGKKESTHSHTHACGHSEWPHNTTCMPLVCEKKPQTGTWKTYKL